ncbi:MAG: hypothetical protein ACTSR8_10305 [Promethearchaeota archaeon]
MSFGEDEEKRDCPYCGMKLSKPYWQHIQTEHPNEYKEKNMWVPLYKEYKGLGMDENMCLMVISELYNVDQAEVKSFLKSENVL